MTAKKLRKKRSLPLSPVQNKIKKKTSLLFVDMDRGSKENKTTAKTPTTAAARRETPRVGVNRKGREERQTG